ncbi:hypothetical protein PENSPDRAFT_662230 [Peniophora sp. CONT]|nr:hypothetical protein PENSPDRAFT_662230 [Peniophora sp. CONT]
MSTEPPPAYISTVHDDTHRGKWPNDLSIMSMGNRPNLIGYLEHHVPTTDGSFSICLAGGNGVFVQKAFYESIPKEHRPPLNTENKGHVSFLTGGSQETLGSTLLPILLTDASNGQKFRLILYANVLENLLIPVFIGQSPETVPFLESQSWGGSGPTYTFNFDGRRIKVKGV